MMRTLSVLAVALVLALGLRAAPLPEKKAPRRLFEADVASPGPVAFSADGKTVTWAKHGAFRVWDAVSGKAVQTWEKKGYDVRGLSANGKAVALLEFRNEMHILDASSGKEVCQLAGEHDFYGKANAVALSPDGGLFAANYFIGARGYHVRIWDAVTGMEQDPVEGPEKGSLRCLAFSADNKLLAMGLDGTDIELYDLATRKKLLRFGEPRPALPEDRPDKGSPSRIVAILSVAFSPDGKTLAAGNNDGGVDLYDAATGKHRLHLGSGPRSLKDFSVPGAGGLAFSADGKTLLWVDTFIAGEGGRTVHLWDLDAGKERPTPAVAGVVHHAALSPDGGKLAVSVGEKKLARVEVWELGAAK